MALKEVILRLAHDLQTRSPIVPQLNGGDRAIDVSEYPLLHVWPGSGARGSLVHRKKLREAIVAYGATVIPTESSEVFPFKSVATARREYVPGSTRRSYVSTNGALGRVVSSTSSR